MHITQVSPRLRRLTAGLGICLALTAVFAAPRAQGADTVTLVNVRSGELGGLSDALEALKLSTTEGKSTAGEFSGRLVIWEAREGGDAAITEASSHALAEFVRKGGSLLLTLARQPGEMPLRCAFMLPTTAWMTRSGVVGGAVSGRVWEGLDFDAGASPRITLPFHHDIRPFHAVERGQGRYEPYEGLIQDILKPPLALSPAHPFWTRPLINRDWRVRGTGEGLKQPPLLITGRYGRGHVAVFAANAGALAASPEALLFWTRTLHWLLPPETPAATPHEAVGIPAPTTEIDAATRTLKVTITNPSATALPLRVLGRILTWEPALVGDVEREATVPAGGRATVDLPIPAITSTSYAALVARDSYVVRLGILSADGADLLSESRVPVDFGDPFSLTVALPELRSVPWPYPDAPEFGMSNRMGIPVATYACVPGEKVDAEIVLDNSGRNLAPLAEVRDETQPSNPSVSALNDGSAMSERKAEKFLQHYGNWEGRDKQENVLTFTLPHVFQIHAVTLNGMPGHYRNQDRKNPGAVEIEVDGKIVAREMSLAARFQREHGLVRLPLSGVQGRVLRLRLPWIEEARPRSAPSLGEVEIFGTDAESTPDARGTLEVSLVDVLHGTAVPVKKQLAEALSGERFVAHVRVKAPRASGVNFYRLEAKYGKRVASAPMLVIEPAHPLLSIEGLKGKNRVELGFIVTRGFRNFFDTGVGTAELGEGWGQPDDLVWAYARGLKQNGVRSKYEAGRLYVSQDNLAHYSTPWRHFYNGEDFYDVATPFLVHRAEEDRHWKTSDTVVLAHSDRWDTGPDVTACHGWQEYEAFNDWLSAGHRGTLKGRTLARIAEEIDKSFPSEWAAFHLERYARHLAGLKAAFSAEHKRLLITAQGEPLIPPAHAREITSVVAGPSDDCTWGMIRDNIPATTGRQMGVMAFTPTLAMSTLAHWGYNSNTLGNMQWHAPAGTTEPSRRLLYDRAFRGMIRTDGVYGSMHTYGYNSNAGDAYTLTAPDYGDWNRVKTLHTLLTPEAPMGAGVVIGNSYLDDPKNTRFSGADPMGVGETRTVSHAVELMHNAGLSIPFSSNARCLEKWRGRAPLIVLNLQHFTERETGILQSLLVRGVKVAAFSAGEPLSPAAAQLFGVKPDGSPAGGKVTGEISGRSLVTGPGRLFVPLDPDKMTAAGMQLLAPFLRTALDMGLTFPPGTAGYGFVSNGRSFVVIEDWMEQPRIVPLRLRIDAGKAGLRAVNVNNHSSLPVQRDGAEWILQVPMPPGDAVLVALEPN